MHDDKSLLSHDLARRLRLLSRIASDTTNAVIITDAEGRTEWVNDGFYRLCGYRLEDLRGRKPGELLQGPDTDRDEVARIHAALEAGRGFVSELVNYDREGRTYWVEIRCSPLYDENGRLEGFLAIETDVTKRREMEQRLREAVRETANFRFALDQHAILSITDAKGVILDVNAKFETISGYRRDELIGQTHRLLKSGRHPDSFYAEMWQTISAGRVWQGVLCNRRKDGSLYWVESSIVPILDEAGKPRQYISIRTEVTNLVETQEQLRAERDFANAAINAIRGTFQVVDQAGRLLRFNRQLLELTGYSAEELAALPAWELVAPEQRETVRTFIQQAFPQGHCEVQADLYTRDGRRIPFLFQSSRFETESGPVLIGTGTDVSRLVELQRDLEKREERLRRSQRYANIGTWDWNIETGELYWSERIPALFGYPEGTLETSYEKFLAAVHPDDRERVVQAVNAALERDVPYEIEHRVVWPDGSVRWLLERGAVTRAADGTPLHMLGVVQDIHARKMAELALAESRGRLEEAQRIARLGHWEADLVTGSLFWSEQVFEIFGYDPATFTPSVEAFYAAVHPDDVEKVRASERRAAETGVHDVVHRIVRPDGTVRWVRELAQLQPDASGRPVRLIGTVQDVTSLKETELALVAAKEQAEQAREAAERANRAKSEFLSSMSHELRTPMNAILGFAQLMDMDATLPEEHRQAVQEILRAGRHLLGLINDVLDLAKVEAGRVDLSLEPVACDELFRECEALVAAQAAEREVTLRVDPVPLVVQADRLRLRQVVANLLTNAIKYNRKGGQAHLQAAREGQGVRISVRDTGPGIPPEKQHELFQAFNRLGAERTDVEGTGIGLVIARRLTEMMGGRIGVDSQPGQGSTFWVWLPAAMPAQLPSEGRETAQVAAPAAEARRQTVLYVEDNPANMRLVAQLLARRPGVEFFGAGTPQAALNLAAARLPDLVLLDINLPEMDGYALLARLRALPGMAAVPVVALTAGATPREVERGQAAGFAEYLTKPLDVRHFYEVVDRLLAAR
ncbi:MAG: PAS domain S-box protein [Burkholderiales bacterium]